MASDRIYTAELIIERQRGLKYSHLQEKKKVSVSGDNFDSWSTRRFPFWMKSYINPFENERRMYGDERRKPNKEKENDVQVASNKPEVNVNIKFMFAR